MAKYMFHDQFTLCLILYSKGLPPIFPSGNKAGGTGESESRELPFGPTKINSEDFANHLVPKLRATT